MDGYFLVQWIRMDRVTRSAQDRIYGWLSRNSHASRRNDEFWWCDDMEVVSTGPTDGRNGPFHVIALDLRAVVYYKKLDLRTVVR